MKVGDKVKVYDRYRFAIPQTGIIKKFSESNDGVEVTLIGHINNPHYVETPDIWIHKWQLRLISVGK